MVDLKELDEVCHKIVESNTKVAPIYDRIVLKYDHEYLPWEECGRVVDIPSDDGYTDEEVTDSEGDIDLTVPSECGSYCSADGLSDNETEATKQNSPSLGKRTAHSVIKEDVLSANTPEASGRKGSSTCDVNERKRERETISIEKSPKRFCILNSSYHH